MISVSDHYAPTQHNLRRIAGLRAIATAVMVVLIVLTQAWLELSLPLLPLALVLVTQGIWALFTWWRSRRLQPISDLEFFLQLTSDVLIFSAVLYFTGGATNPFAWFYLLPLMIAATVLPSAYVWGMAGLTVVCYSLLMIFYVPLPPAIGQLTPMQHNSGFFRHVFGMWFGFVLSAVLVSHFVTRMARTLRERDRILAEAREQVLRDERLVALGTLAAGAAHELGTPLGTMALVIDELLDEYPPERDAELHEQLRLLREQVDRSKQALSVISASAGQQQADSGRSRPADQYLRELVQQWRVRRPGIEFRERLDGPVPAPPLLADRALEQALANILDNAADASPEKVELRATWSTQSLEIQVLDRGPGLSESAASAAGKTPFSSKEQGLGVGLFLAHAVIERLGGEVTHRRREHGGTCTCIRLPLIGVRP
ncbi:MAG TPA: HAMP domain-containing histidine kinase [Candidatus Tenderia sp.]|nr:HAMP domain-containing histidine kinase [Candidatus Tenderia sp.]